MARARSPSPPLLALDLGSADLCSGALAALAGAPRPVLVRAVRAFGEATEPSSPSRAAWAVSRLVSALNARHETIASREVTASFLATPQSVDAIVAFASERAAADRSSEFYERWARVAVVRAAAERGRGVLEQVLSRTSAFMPATSRDLETAAISGGSPTPFGGPGWEGAGADPASRALLAVAFGTEIVPVEFHEMGGREAIQNLVWTGLKVRDLGLIDDDKLWRFYERCEERGRTARVDHSRDASVRAWLVDMGSRRLTSAIREACVALAREALDQL